MKRLTLILLLTLPVALSAQIYKTTDSQGNVVYTDKPSAASSSAEEVKLHTTNTAPPPPDIPRPAPMAITPTDASEQLGYTVEIAVPTTETTIPMGPGNFLLTANVQPPIAGDEMLQLHMDGIPWGDPQTSSSWGLTNIFRGEHNFTVSVVDADGSPLVSSEPVRVYVMRPSVNNKNRN